MVNTTAILSSAVAALTGLHANSFTVAFWVNPYEATEALSLLLDKAWHVVMNADGTLTFTILNSVTPSETSVSTTGVLVLNDWNFVVVVYNKELLTISIFLNGAKNSSSFTDLANATMSQYTAVFQLGDTI